MDIWVAVIAGVASLIGGTLGGVGVEVVRNRRAKQERVDKLDDELREAAINLLTVASEISCAVDRLAVSIKDASPTLDAFRDKLEPQRVAFARLQQRMFEAGARVRISESDDGVRSKLGVFEKRTNDLAMSFPNAEKIYFEGLSLTIDPEGFRRAQNELSRSLVKAREPKPSCWKAVLGRKN